MRARNALSLLAAAAATFAAPSTIAATPYKTAATCAGFPRVALEVPRGWCVALVADQASGLVFPRRIAEVAPGASGSSTWAAGSRTAAACSSSSCRRAAPTAAPAMLWPAHVAPLQMLAVPATAKNAFAGQLVVAWHGYRAAGHRVVSYALDARGRPGGPPRVWIGGWHAVKGDRPLGAPTGVLVDSAGRLLVVEDRNRTLLMLTRDDAAAPAASAPATTIR